MKETIQDNASRIFFDICGKKPIEVDLFFSNEIHYPKIEYEPKIAVYFPIPREVQEIQIIQDSAFSNYEKSQDTIFTLFFASICHQAGHAKVTDFSKYKNWMKGKTKSRAYEVIEFIEDIRVNEFLKNNFPEYYSEIVKIEEFFNKINEKNELGDLQKYSKKVFADKFLKNITKEKEAIREKIVNLDTKDNEEFIQIADTVYESPSILSNQRYSYREHHKHVDRITNWNKNITLNTEGKFFDTVVGFGEIWVGQLRHKAKITKKYSKLLEGLEFNKVDFATENIAEYDRLKSVTRMFLKKMISQMRHVSNSRDNGMPEDMGLLEMQAAIQAIASQNNRVQIFEQDDANRAQEVWSIIVDTSSSMKLKFGEMQEFTMCLVEAANAVNAGSGKWGFFTFNNNFTIIKDHDQNYDQSAKARVGGIEIKGMSFIADAIKLATRVLDGEIIEKKIIFVVTDGQALGTIDADIRMNDTIKEARKKGIQIVSIGIEHGNAKNYSGAIPYDGLRKTIPKFLRAYQKITQDTA